MGVTELEEVIGSKNYGDYAMKTNDAVQGLAILVFFGFVGWGLLQFGEAKQESGSPVCTGDECTVPLPISQQETETTVTWPPVVDRPYPDLKLIDGFGQTVRLSSFKGSVLVIEPLAMTCAACQAFSGGHRYGSLGGVTPQKNLPSIEELFPQFTGGVSLSDDRLVFIQILLYDMSTSAPSAEDVTRWRDHFQMDRSDNYLVFAAPKHILGPASLKMIPGFQLVDQNFLLRSDSTGHNPRDNLYTELLPMVPALL